MSEPTLADDEARLAEIADGLQEAMDDAVPEWLRRRARALAPEIDVARLESAIAATMQELSPVLAHVLHADVDAGAGNPLAAVRAATARLTDVLLDAGVEPVGRDDFDARAFPSDVFALGPASFAEIHEELHEPGLVWGAARAHVHLRRRRELER